MEALIGILRRQLRLDDIEEPGLDSQLSMYWLQAKASVCNALGYARDKYIRMGWEELPEDLFGAMVMTAAHLYENRESSTLANLRRDDFVTATIHHYEQLSPREE